MHDFFGLVLCFLLIVVCAALLCVSVLAGALGEMPPHLALLLATFALALIGDIPRPNSRF